LIAQEKEFDHAFSRRYYRENLRFMFREREKEGLHEFHRRCLGLGLFAIHDSASALELPLV
jgi:predicted solute-binding protein